MGWSGSSSTTTANSSEEALLGEAFPLLLDPSSLSSSSSSSSHLSTFRGHHSTTTSTSTGTSAALHHRHHSPFPDHWLHRPLSSFTCSEYAQIFWTHTTMFWPDYLYPKPNRKPVSAQRRRKLLFSYAPGGLVRAPGCSTCVVAIPTLVRLSTRFAPSSRASVLGWDKGTRRGERETHK